MIDTILCLFVEQKEQFSLQLILVFSKQTFSCIVLLLMDYNSYRIETFMISQKTQRFCLIRKIKSEGQSLIQELISLLSGKSQQLMLISRQRAFIQVYLLVMALKVLLLDLIVYRDEGLLLVLWIRHLLLLFLFLTALLVNRLKLPPLTSLTAYNNYTEVCLALLGLLCVFLWTEVYVRVSLLSVVPQPSGLNYGAQLLTFSLLIVSKIQRNLIKGVFVLIWTAYVSVRCTVKPTRFEYGEFIEMILLGVMICGVACGSRRENRKCGAYCNLVEQEDEMTAEVPLVTNTKNEISVKEVKENKIQSKKQIAKAQESNKKLFLRVMLQSLDYGLLLTDCNFQTIYANQWILLKYSKDMFSSLTVPVKEGIEPIKDHLLSLDIYNTNLLNLPKVFCKILGCVQIRITKHNIDDKVMCLFEVRKVEGENPGQPEEGLEEARSLTKQELQQQGQNPTDMIKIYELMMDRDIINIQIMNPLQTPSHLISFPKLKQELDELFTPVKSSVTVTWIPTPNHYFLGNYELFKYFIFCVYRITKPTFSTFEVVFEKNTFKMNFIKCDALYKRFLMQLIEPCCDNWTINDKSIEITLCQDEIGLIYSQLDLTKGNIAEVSQFRVTPKGPSLPNCRIYLLGIDPELVESRLSRAGFSNIEELNLEEGRSIDPNAVVVSDVKWIFVNARNPLIRKVRNRIVVVTQGYYGDSDASQIKFIGGKHFMVPIYSLQNEVRHVATASVY